MAQPRNKKRRSRKRGGGASGGSTSAGRPATGGPSAPRSGASTDGTAATKGGAGPAKGGARPGKGGRASAKGGAGPAAPATRTMKADRSEAPPPIWAPLPITELLILVGLVVAGIGLFTKNGGLVLGGLALLVVSSLELAVREHLAGYRSHTSLIAAVVAMLTAVGLGLLLNVLDVGLPQWPLVVVAVLVFAAMFRILQRLFRARSGGFAYRV